MEKTRPDYEKMAEEYSKVTPFSLQIQDPENNDDNADDLSVICGLYARISAFIEILPVENTAKLIIEKCNKNAKILYDTYTEIQKKFGLKQTEKPIINKNVTFTQAVRLCLKASAEALDISQDKEKIFKTLPVLRQQNLHLLLLTLTAF